jgi:iron(III) transport system ATP-binding protein
MLHSNALTLKGVSKSFGDVAALTDVSFSLPESQILCLVGKSGCGKSTLLRLIGGIERPDQGSIFLSEQEIVGKNCFVEPDKREIGFVFQDYALFPHLSVQDNIAFGIRQFSTKERQQRVGDLLELVGLGHMAKRFPHSLSGGEQQRIALARALAPRPKLILMDEPFSNLDLGLKRRVRDDTIALLRQVDATAIMVTHDPQEALLIGDQVILMDRGHIVQQGSGDELYHRPSNAYAAEFFGDFNVLDAQISGSEVVTKFGRFPNLKNFEQDLKCKAYVRPIGLRFADVDAEGHAFEASLIGRDFLGDFELLTYQSDLSNKPLKMMRASGGQSAPLRARISIDPHSVLTFVI